MRKYPTECDCQSAIYNPRQKKGKGGSRAGLLGVIGVGTQFNFLPSCVQDVCPAISWLYTPFPVLLFCMFNSYPILNMSCYRTMLPQPRDYFTLGDQEGLICMACLTLPSPCTYSSKAGEPPAEVAPLFTQLLFHFPQPLATVLNP